MAERYGKKGRWRPVHRPLHASRHSRTPSRAPALTQLGDPQADVTRLGGDQPQTGAVALGHWLRCALVAAGADPLDGFGFGFDQLLHHHPDRLADEIDAVTGGTPKARKRSPEPGRTSSSSWGSSSAS